LRRNANTVPPSASKQQPPTDTKNITTSASKQAKHPATNPMNDYFDLPYHQQQSQQQPLSFLSSSNSAPFATNTTTVPTSLPPNIPMQTTSNIPSFSSSFPPQSSVVTNSYPSFNNPTNPNSANNSVNLSGGGMVGNSSNSKPMLRTMSFFDSAFMKGSNVNSNPSATSNYPSQQQQQTQYAQSSLTSNNYPMFGRNNGLGGGDDDDDDDDGSHHNGGVNSAYSRKLSLPDGHYVDGGGGNGNNGDLPTVEIDLSL
jgi:hypothetical protein